MASKASMASKAAKAAKKAKVAKGAKARKTSKASKSSKALKTSNKTNTDHRTTRKTIPSRDISQTKTPQNNSKASNTTTTLPHRGIARKSPPTEDVTQTKPSQNDSQVPSQPSFHLFTHLQPEIRSKIWSLSLPGPRVLHIKSSPTSPGTYTTCPISYGGSHPAALQVCRESRGEALRCLTLKFNAFWNLKQDALYVEMRKWRADDARKMVVDMRVRGLLDGFQHLAMDHGIWWSKMHDPRLASMMRLPSLTSLHLIVRTCDWHKDILNPGVAWSLLSVQEPLEGGFMSQATWGHEVPLSGTESERFIEEHQKRFEPEWEERREMEKQPVMTYDVIEGRVEEELPCYAGSCQPPGYDWFG